MRSHFTRTITGCLASRTPHLEPTARNNCGPAARLIRIKGYRPPQSKILPGLNDANLSEFNFEWLASSTKSLGSADPFMENGIVKIPHHLDDYPMYRSTMSFAEWETRLLELVSQRDFVVIGLHDCYAEFWLDRYEELLCKLKAQAQLMTLDEVAARVTLGKSRWFLDQDKG
jgi:hypothetical protein